MLPIPSRIAAAVAAVVVAGGVAISSAPAADAAGASIGQVTETSLLARSAPTTHSTVYGSFHYSQKLTLGCKVHGETIRGNDLWYLVPSEGMLWVSARYVKNLNTPPRWCGNGMLATVKTTTRLTERKAPSTLTPKVGSLAARTSLKIVCKVNSQNVAGNTIWYYTTTGHWISARYAANVGSAPGWCI